MEDNNKKDLNENNEKKGKDLSEQLDKLFSSLNLSRKKEEPVKVQEEPEQSSLEAESSVEKMFWGDSKETETAISSEDVTITESPVVEETGEFNIQESDDFTVLEDTDSVKSLEDELNALFGSQESQPDSTSLNSATEVKLDAVDDKDDIDINGIMNSLDDITLETESVSIDENLVTDFNVASEPSFSETSDYKVTESSTPEINNIEANFTEEKPVNNDYNYDTDSAFYPNDEQKSKSSIHSLIDDELQKQIDDLKETGYQGQGFVYEEGVNSETIPAVDEHIETSETGGIDYDKMVGENHLMNIESIYDCNNLIRQMSETVFMIELYGRTLPENLPIDVKRESVLSIIRASSIQIDDLLSDAYQRIDVLNEVLEDVAQKAEELDTENKAEIQMLEEKIQDLKNRIEKRSQYKQSQNAMIGYEIQRIVNIVEFIEPE